MGMVCTRAFRSCWARMCDHRHAPKSTTSIFFCVALLDSVFSLVAITVTSWADLTLISWGFGLQDTISQTGFSWMGKTEDWCSPSPGEGTGWEQRRGDAAVLWILHWAFCKALSLSGAARLPWKGSCKSWLRSTWENPACPSHCSWEPGDEMLRQKRRCHLHQSSWYKSGFILVTSPTYCYLFRPV